MSGWFATNSVTSELVSSDVVVVDMGAYWVLTMLLLFAFDKYASKKLGGKRSLGYKVLRIPKFFALIAASAYTIGIVFAAMNGFEIKVATLTYMGLPYFIIWVFYLVNVLRRVKAETKGRNW